MNIWPFLHFFCFLLYSYLGVFILTKNPRSSLNRVFFAVLCCFALWSVGMTFIHNPFLSKATVTTVAKITSLGWISFSSFILWFFFIFAQKKKMLNLKSLYLLLFILPLLFIYKNFTGILIVDFVKQPFGWSSVWGKSIWTYLFYAYYFIFVLLALSLAFDCWRKTENPSEKKQAMIMFSTGIITLFIGTLFNVLLPQLGIQKIPKIADLIILIWVLGIAYAMMKYRLLAITPAIAADNILSTMTDSVILLDSNTNIVTVNNATSDLLGYEKKALEKKPIGLLFAKNDSMATNLNKAFTSYDIKNEEFFFKTKRGKEIPVLFSSTVMKDEKNLSVGIVCIVRNISKRIRMESQLRQAQKMETIGLLAGGVAHDLNNILSGVVSYPELILLDLPEDSPLREPILTIQKSGEKAAVIVQDLLTLARRGVAVTEVVNLNRIISEQLKSLEFQNLILFHQGLDVTTNFEKGLLNVKGSPTHLSKTVMNLISNAAEAMSHGGRISISTKNIYIDRAIRGYDYVKEGDYVTIAVSDTGIGICKEDMERIFEPFYTKKVMGRSGTGLGMAVVWGTVKDHNGYIDVESTEGKGTTFTLYFPVIREEIALDKSQLCVEDYMGKGELIVVVDDVKEQREIASRMLKRLGYSVTSVSSGKMAIEYIKNNSADLMILDMIMDPGIDGLETYRRIIKIHPNQKAIIASGFSETQRVKEAQRLGAGKYIKKPYDLEKIGIAVKEELGRERKRM